MLIISKLNQVYWKKYFPTECACLLLEAKIIYMNSSAWFLFNLNVLINSWIFKVLAMRRIISLRVTLKKDVFISLKTNKWNKQKNGFTRERIASNRQLIRTSLNYEFGGNVMFLSSAFRSNSWSRWVGTSLFSHYTIIQNL